MKELSIMCDTADSKLTADGQELQRPGNDVNGGDVTTTKRAFDVGDLYLCKKSRRAMEGSLGAVCEAVDCVFDNSQHPRAAKRAFVCVRPPGHHCSTDYPAGFCWINNVQVGISYAMSKHGVTHAAIIDFDLHHGDGSQSIAWEHNENVARLPRNAPNARRTAIGYFSLHDINSYPCEMGDRTKVQNASLCIEGAHGQTVWNSHLQPWKTEEEFWQLYETRYSKLLDKARKFLVSHTTRVTASAGVQPNAVIFLSSGFDASEWESPGMQRHKVSVPTDFYARFTQDILKIAQDPQTGVNGRVISVLEGGYSDRALCSGVFSHVSGLVGRRAESATALEDVGGDLATEMANKLNLHDTPKIKSYDTSWWNQHSLAELEVCRHPAGPPVVPKRLKTGPLGNFTSATQSFSAKVVSDPKGRRVSSSTFTGLPKYPHLAPGVVSKPAKPPPPTVNWAVAACELAHILIPIDRDTTSHNVQDLNPEPKIKRERHTTFGITGTDAIVEDPGPRRQLRERKPKEITETLEPARRPASRADRRRTVAGPDVAPGPQHPPLPILHRRRSSAASTASGFSDLSSLKPVGVIPAAGRVPSVKLVRRGSVVTARISVPPNSDPTATKGSPNLSGVPTQ